MERKIVRSYTAARRDLEMLEAVARYHGFSKSATITSLVKKEFWRVFPAGTGDVRCDDGARVASPTDAKVARKPRAAARGARERGSRPANGARGRNQRQG